MANGLIRLRDNLDPIIGKQRRRERRSATPPRLFSPQKPKVGRALSEGDEDGNRGPSINDILKAFCHSPFEISRQLPYLVTLGLASSSTAVTEVSLLSQIHFSTTACEREILIDPK